LRRDILQQVPRPRETIPETKWEGPQKGREGGRGFKREREGRQGEGGTVVRKKRGEVLKRITEKEVLHLRRGGKIKSEKVKKKLKPRGDRPESKTQGTTKGGGRLKKDPGERKHHETAGEKTDGGWGKNFEKENPKKNRANKKKRFLQGEGSPKKETNYRKGRHL